MDAADALRDGPETELDGRTDGNRRML